jgi:hypothetical protein
MEGMIGVDDYLLGAMPPPRAAAMTVVTGSLKGHDDGDEHGASFGFSEGARERDGFLRPAVGWKRQTKRWDGSD